MAVQRLDGCWTWREDMENRMMVCRYLTRCFVEEIKDFTD